MCLSEIVNGILIGIFGGAFAGIGIWLLDRIREAWLFKRDENRIIKLLRDGNIAFDMSTSHRIAADVNLTEDRVRFVCSYSKKIIRNRAERETWKLRGNE